MRKSPWIVSVAVLCSAIVACNDSAVSNGTPDDKFPGEPTATSQQPLMRAATSCEDLTEALKDHARQRLARASDPSSNSYSDDGDSASPPVAMTPGRAGGTAGTSAIGGVTTGVAAPSPTNSGPMAESPAIDTKGVPTSYTTTNTQVAGVDEADIVKSDGVNVYVLRTPMPASDGVQRSAEVVVSKAFPATEMSLTTRTNLEGSPVEMFVTGEPGSASHKVVVYSLVPSAALYKEAGIESPASTSDAPLFPNCMGCVGPEANMTKITVLDFAGGTLSVVRESYVEGNYLSARRSGDVVRTTVSMTSRAPKLRTYATEAEQQKAALMALQDVMEGDRDVADVPSEEISTLVAAKLAEVLIEANEKEIAKIQADQWLPRVFTRSGGKLVVGSLDCENFYIPRPGSGADGVTFVALDDLAAPADKPQGAAIVGLADTMYQNAETVVLASQVWNYRPVEKTEPRVKTVLHSFDVGDPAAIKYEASGEVPGNIYGQFAIDEQNGVFRVATTDGSTQWANGLSVLKAKAASLETVGTVKGLAPAEQISAVRYVGDTAYMVTRVQFRDPLFVIDTSNAEEPKLLGEAPIEGFSTYVHPLDSGHLLTIGRDGVGNAMSGNLAIRIYDVSDPTNPAEAHKLAFEASGSSEAQANHKAFAYYPEQKLLAVPFLGYGYDSTTGYSRPINSVELFSVDVTSGLKRLGSVDANVLLSAAERGQDGYYCNYYSGSAVDRGMFIEDVLYAVGQRGIVAANVNALSQPVGTVPFQADIVPSYCWTSVKPTVPTTGGAPATGQGGVASGGKVTTTPASGGASGGVGIAVPVETSTSGSASAGGAGGAGASE